MKIEKLKKLRDLSSMLGGLYQKLQGEYDDIRVRRNESKEFLAEYHSNMKNNPEYYERYYSQFKYKEHGDSSLKRLLAEEAEIQQEFNGVWGRFQKVGNDKAQVDTLVRRCEEFVLSRQGNKLPQWFKGAAPIRGIPETITV